MANWSRIKPPLGTPPNMSQVKELGIVGLWLFNEGGGSKAYDLSGNNNHGTLTNMANPATATSGWGAGKFGNALRFDGSNDYVQVNDADILEPTNVTISVWVKITLLAGSHRAFLAKRSASTTGFIIFWLTTSNSINFDWGGQANRWNTGYNPPLDVWTHLVFTRDSNGRKLYVNGSLNNSTAVAGTSVTDTSSLRIGYDTSAAQYPFNGIIDDVRIYNRALSAGEVKELYLSPYCMFPKRSAVTYFVPASGVTAVSDTVQFLHNVRATMPDMLQLVHNVRTAIPDTVQLIHNVRTAIPDTVQLIYDVKSIVSDTVEIRHNIRQAVSDTLQTLYNVNGILSDTLQLIHNVKKTISDNIEIRHNINAVIADALSILYDVASLSYFPVNNSIQAIFNTRTIVSDSVQSIYNLKQVVSDNLQILHNTRISVDDTIQAIYNVRSAVSDLLNIIANTGLEVPLIIVTLSVKKPDVTLSVKKPDVTLSVKKPDVTLSVN